MNEKQQDTALDLLESASNLLHGPLMFLMGTPGHDIHKEAVDGWMEKYEALTDEVEDGA